MTQPAPLPANEAARVAALRHLAILDTAAEEAFERLVDLAVLVLDVPAALISLVDSDRQWFKARRGIAVQETARDVAFCAHAILRDEVCLVPDAAVDPRFAGNPLVTGDPRIRFYAGAPLKTEDGYAIGTLCVVDFAPRPDFGPVQSDILLRLAALASDELALRVRRHETEEAVILKTGFIETLSHEIRTPLSGIIGMVDMLATSGLREDQTRYAATLKAASAHLLQIVNDVLDFSKLEAGALTTEPVACNLTDIVEETLAVLAPRARGYELAIGAVFMPGVPRHLITDPTRLRQVLLNLVGNALKFTNYGGVYVVVRVLVPVHEGRMTLGLEVHDTGIGIPAGELPRLFKRFSQLQGSDLRQGGGGSGLGLAISERLVRLMGGNISVQSTLGKGSAFSVMLPVQVQADAPDAAAVPLAGRHVLVAEPNPVDQYVLRGQLEALGARVLVVGQAEAVAPALNAAWSAGQAYDTLILAQAFAEQLDINREPQALGPVRVVRTETQGSADMLVKPAGEVALLRAVAASVPLPASLAPPAPVAEPAAEPSRPLHVLLAEDNEINQLVASAMISSLGHELTLVVNGIEAVSAAATGGYDLVLMDMMMPGIDGPTATRAIRKLRGPAAEVYIIALTANATPEHRAQCLQAGMNDFVTKPVTRQRLNEALQRYVHWAATRPGITP